ncbi:MAG: glycosyltransferase family 4 protein [Actinomycetota bacterium]|nr:glycosyltransferase family 4 protein [Actinomycetota bacterium]
MACLQDGPYTDDLERAGVRVVRLRARRLRYVWMWGLTVARLARLALDHDVLLSWQVKGNYYGTPAARIARKPVAWWDHGIRPARGERRYLIDNKLPSVTNADLVVTSSEASAVRHRRARVILPGIPLEPFVNAARENARALLSLSPVDQAVGIVGRLQPWKGQHVFLRAAARVHERFPRARFLVIGGTPGGFSAGYPAELSSLVRELGIADRVDFLGHRDDIPALLAGLDVFVLASFGEPFGLVTVEAMASGVPVVATDAGGTREILTDPSLGALVPPGDEAAMADAIIRYLAEPEYAAGVAVAARADVVKRFDIARYVREIEDLVIEMASA